MSAPASSPRGVFAPFAPSPLADAQLVSLHRVRLPLARSRIARPLLKQRAVRALAHGALFLAVVSCAARQVEVQNAPRAAAEVFVSVSNRLTQPVNVYVVRGSTDAFLQRVPANSTELVPVPDVVSGTTVDLVARTVDGTRTFTRRDVVLSGTVPWEIR